MNSNQHTNMPFDIQSIGGVSNIDPSVNQRKKLVIKLSVPSSGAKRVRDIPENFTSLKKMVDTQLNKKRSSTKELSYAIQYTDEYGDAINLSDDEDLMTAYEVAESALGNQLKLNVVPRNNDESALEQSFYGSQANASEDSKKSNQAQTTQVQMKLESMQISPVKQIEEPKQIVEKQIVSDKKKFEEDREPEVSGEDLRKVIKETLADQMSSDSSDSDDGAAQADLIKDGMRKLTKDQRKALRKERRMKKKEIKQKLRENHGGLPRKCFKKMIKKELEKQKGEILNQLMNCEQVGEEPKDINDFQNQRTDNKKVIHHGVVCDGCGMNPIIGVRYKCSVLKDFDFCQVCEERRPHEHPFLKIINPQQCPKAIFTVIDDKNPNAPCDLEQNFNSTFFRNMGPDGQAIGRGINQFLKGIFGGHENQGNWRGGRGGHGRRHGGCHGKRQFHQRNQGQMCPWKLKRAEIVSGVPEGTIPLQLDKTDFVKVTVKNNTDWPWKPGCVFRNNQYDNGVEEILEPIEIPVNDYVVGKSDYSIRIPLTVKPSAKLTEHGKNHEATFSFCGPKGMAFGVPITIKFKVVKVVQEHEVYQTASELLEKQEFSKFKFEDICDALIMTSMHMDNALDYLVKKQSVAQEQQENKTDIGQQIKN